MWEFPPISCWRKWPRTSRSQIKCTPFSRKKFRQKCGLFPSEICYFWEKLRKRSWLISESAPLGNWLGKGSPLFRHFLEKRPDISSSSTPEALTILRFWKCLRRVKASAWRRLSMMILYLWSRSSLFYWSNAMW